MPKNTRTSLQEKRKKKEKSDITFLFVCLYVCFCFSPSNDKQKFSPETLVRETIYVTRLNIFSEVLVSGSVQL